jgi:hypothetical protein
MNRSEFKSLVYPLGIRQRLCFDHPDEETCGLSITKDLTIALPPKHGVTRGAVEVRSLSQ